MTDIYVNTTLSGICNSAIEMDKREHAEENVYKTLEVVGTSRYRNNVSQRKAEPEEIMEEKSSSSHRIRAAKSESSRKISLIQCIVVILVSLTVSSITGVVVYNVTKDGMKDMQLQIESRVLAFSALSNQSESFQDQITLFEKEMRQNVTILKQQMQDKVTALKQETKENVTVLEQQMKDNNTVLAQRITYNFTVFEQQVKLKTIQMKQKIDSSIEAFDEILKSISIVITQLNETTIKTISDNEISKLKLNNTHSGLLFLNETFNSSMKQTEIAINNLTGNISSKLTILYDKLDDVQLEQSELADRFDKFSRNGTQDSSTSIAAFTATRPEYYGRRYSSNYYTLNFSRTIYNLGGDFDSSTGMFTCTKPGTYYFSVFLMKKRSSIRINQMYCYLLKNSSYIIEIKVDPTDDDTDKGNAQAANSAVIHLNTWDVVYLGGCGSVSFMESWSSFSGFLLYTDA